MGYSVEGLRKTERALQLAMKLFEAHPLHDGEIEQIINRTGYTQRTIVAMLSGNTRINTEVLAIARGKILARKPGLQGDAGFNNLYAELAKVASKPISKQSRGSNHGKRQQGPGHQEWPIVTPPQVIYGPKIQPVEVAIPDEARQLHEPSSTGVNADTAFHVVKNLIPKFTPEQRAQLVMMLLEQS